jgi:hypothetical protein
VADLPNSSGSGADSVKPVKLFTVIQREHSQSISSKELIEGDKEGFGRRKHGRGAGMSAMFMSMRSGLKTYQFLDETLMGVYARPRRNPPKSDH